MRQSQKYTAGSQDGFEVDISRREQTGDGPRSVKGRRQQRLLGVASPRVNMLLKSQGFSAVIVAVNGTTVRIKTVHTAAFVTFKWWVGGQA